MNLFSHAPFIRILPAFVLGVTISFFIPVNQKFIWEGFIASALIFSIWIHTPVKYQYSYKFVSAILISLLFFAIGFLLNLQKEEEASKNLPSNYDSYPYAFLSVNSIPVQTGKMKRAEVIVKSFSDIKSKKDCSVKAYFYFTDSSQIDLQVGDELIVRNNIQEISPPQNPGQFDFRYYASLKRIHFQFRLASGEWERISCNKKFSILNMAKKIRDNLLACYRKAGLEEREYAVMSALVLGYDDEIDKELMSAFSASGTLHILSVSGMHVGIVFSILSILFKKMERKKGWWLLRLILMLIIIWCYSILTGFSPSVIRSAMMFSFILLGKSMNRNSNIYNTLAASILVICICFDPIIILEPGFQLSYLAVAGIAFLYKPILNWFYFKNKIASAIWNLTAVSIAAQISTFPISIYYFHQFPNYFIPANLLIIPVSTAAIFGGIILLIIAPVNWLSVKMGWLLKYTIILLDQLAFFIKDLPYSVTPELYSSLLETILLYIILLLMIFYLMYRSIQILKTTVIFIILFMITKEIYQLQVMYRDEILVYSFHHPIIEVVKGEKAFLFYWPEDSSKAIRFSNDLNTKYRLQSKNKTNFILDSAILFQNKYLVLGQNYFEFDSVNHFSSIFYLKDDNTNYVKTKLLYSNIYIQSDSTYNLKKNAFIAKMKNSKQEIFETIMKRVGKPL